MLERKPFRLVRLYQIIQSEDNQALLLIQGAFDIFIPILGMLIWACPNLILTKIKIICNPFPVFYQISNMI